MLSIGKHIDCGKFKYQIVGDTKNKLPSGFSHRVYYAKTKKIFSDDKIPTTDRFIKFVSEESRELINIMENENKFRMYYPYIASVLGYEKGVTEKGEQVYILEMEHLGEMNLYEALENATISEKEMFSYMLQLLYAAEYYSKGKDNTKFLHRDIKPQNVMICKKNGRGCAVLIDFDLAHIPGSTHTTRLIEKCKKAGKKYFLGGTEGYIDPRAWGACEMDIGLDIYSMGRTFCFCLLNDEWRRKQEEAGYFLETENEKIKSRVKAFYENNPDECEEKITDKEWIELAYGVDMDRLKPHLGTENYKPLIKMIRKMVAPLHLRYKDFSVIIDEMEVFLKGLYGPEEFEEMFTSQLILEQEQSKNAHNKRIIRCTYPNGDGEFHESGKYNSVKMNNLGMVDIKLAKDLVVTLYNQNGELYYISYQNGTRKKLEHGEIIFHNGYSVQIEVKGERK